MRIDPVLRSLVDDPAPQHAAQKLLQEALAAWRADPALDELADYGAGAPLSRCLRLAALLEDGRNAAAFAGSLVRAFAPVLAAAPLGRMPFRQASQAGTASLVLGDSGRAILALAVREPGTVAHAVVGFADGERHDVILAGSGRGTIVRRRDDGGFDREGIALAPGTALSLETRREALLVDRVDTALVSLRLTRLADTPGPLREYSLAHGRLVAQAAGNPHASRHELMLAVLGRMGRADAAPVLAEIAREGSDHLRWQALRECLALDTATGFRALSAVARDPADELAGQAGALRAQLIEAYPQLAEVACPA